MAACELEGVELDAAVARCEGAGFSVISGEWGYRHGGPTTGGREAYPLAWSPSRDWAHGGPIIEREQIGTWVKVWVSSNSDAVTWEARVRMGYETSTGPTPLIAAMRAYVASKATP